MPTQSTTPATGERIKDYKPHTDAAVDEILTKVDTAQKAWATVPLAERAALVKRAGDHLRANAEKYGEIITQEMGKLRAGGIAEVEKCALNCDYYADNAEKILAPEHVKIEASKSYVRFDPLGVVLAVMPWNFPFWQVWRFLAPALLAGNGAVLKHASNVPGSALAIEESVRAAGFPEDIFRTLLIGAKSVSRVIENPIIKAVTLTGSEAAGSQVAATAGKVIKKTVLELGGNDPFIVLEDADLPACVVGANAGRMVNSGQSCVSSKRFIIVESQLEAFISGLVAQFKALKIGDPTDSETTVAPMAREDLRDDLHKQVEAAVAAGAKVEIGGQPADRPGAYYQPTVLSNVTETNPIFSQETFGPVASIIVAKDEADAVRLANLSPYGLSSSVWSKDVARAERVAEQIEAGGVFINAITKSDPRMPFGGIKLSGYGREMSHYGLKEFVNIKTVVVK
ncbi:succinate-semialdehyde dehydrogenase [bacterium]|nr:succinate-semialdehyde dehydrogenase [bacterium]